MFSFNKNFCCDKKEREAELKSEVEFLRKEVHLQRVKMQENSEIVMTLQVVIT